MTSSRPPAEGESPKPSPKRLRRDGNAGRQSELTRAHSTEAVGALVHSDRPVEIENVYNVFKTAAAISSAASAAIVAIFLQRGEDLSLQTLLFAMAVASVAVLLMSIFVSGILYRGRQHHHSYSRLYHRTAVLNVSGVVGASLLAWSLTFLGSEGYTLELGDDEVGLNRGDLFAANLMVADRGQENRALLTVVNNGSSTKILTEASFEVDIRDPGTACFDGFGPIIKLEDQIYVSSGSVESLPATVEGGPLDGSQLNATGLLVPDCNDLFLSISVPVHIRIAPGGTEMLAIDVPKQMKAVTEQVVSRYSDHVSEYDLGDSHTVRLDLNVEEAIWSSATLSVATGQRNSFACVTRLLSSDPSLPAFMRPEISENDCMRLSDGGG